MTEIKISTHTPLAGRDDSNRENWNSSRNISTHTPLAGRDTFGFDLTLFLKRFLLTRPLRDVTAPTGYTEGNLQDFYSHAPCGT